MFYTFAEKRKSGFSSRWHLRQIAFDTRCRHLYISQPIDQPEEIVPPSGYPNPSEAIRDRGSSRGSSTVASPSVSPPASLRPSTVRAARQSRANLMPTLSSVVYDESIPEAPAPVRLTSRWSRKLKLEMVAVVAEEQRVLLDEGPQREKDFYEMVFFGELRDMPPDTTPPTEPLLCLATGLGGMPQRFTVRNAEFIRDPFFLQELHQSLQSQFDVLRALRDSGRARLVEAGQPVPEDAAQQSAFADGAIRSAEDMARDATQLTLRSPREGKKGRFSSSIGARHALRFRNEYEFRRFRYVVQTVLGYDRLCGRPYRGLPPLDPRNGIVMAQIPMHVFHTFRQLEKPILYTFIRGDLVGRSTKGVLNIMYKGAYLCLTHDHIIVFRESCTILRWCEMKHVQTFEYHCHGGHPYVSFQTDPGSTDIIFIPQPPLFGPEAIRHFSPQAETLRILEVVRAAFYASLDTRRAIRISGAAEDTVRGFVARVEAEMGSALNFDPPVLVLGSESDCDLPRERLSDAWRAVQVIYRHQDIARAGHTAVPLYEGHPNSDTFEPEVLQEVKHRLESERVAPYDVVGMNEREQQRVRGELQEGGHPDLAIAGTGASRGRGNRSARSSESGDGEANAYPYSVPGSAYVRAASGTGEIHKDMCDR